MDNYKPLMSYNITSHCQLSVHKNDHGNYMIDHNGKITGNLNSKQVTELFKSIVNQYFEVK